MMKWSDIRGLVKNGNPAPRRRVERTDEEWRAALSPEQYRVTREHGTERPFSSEMCSLFEPGLYACVCCDTLLFDSEEKFESGTGWPSFTQPVEPDAVAYHGDNTFGMSRVETLCNTCDAHLGHVFPDGPRPSGLRYCINAVALQKVAKPVMAPAGESLQSPDTSVALPTEPAPVKKPLATDLTETDPP